MGSQSDRNVKVQVEETAESSVQIYLNSIARYQVLSREEEQSLGKTIADGKEAQKLLEQNNNAPELQEQVNVGKAAKQKLIAHNLKLVVSCVKGYKIYDSSLTLLDLIQEGNLGLMKAVDHYDYHSTNKFSTYAMWWIRQSINRAIYSSSHTIRLPEYLARQKVQIRKFQQQYIAQNGSAPTHQEIAEALHLSLSQVETCTKYNEAVLSLDQDFSYHSNSDNHKPLTLLDSLTDRDPTHNPADVAETNAAVNEVHALMEMLSAKERYVIEHRFGINNAPVETLEEIGQELHVTRERIRQLQNSALDKMRKSTDTQSDTRQIAMV